MNGILAAAAPTATATASAVPSAASAPSSSSAMVVARALSGLPRPLSAASCRRFDALVEALGQADGAAAAAALAEVDEDCLVALSAVVIADEALRRAGILLSDGAGLLHLVRERARSAQGRASAGDTTCWILPASPEDRTAAQVAAVILGRSLMICRPWLWDVLPGNSPFLVVGRDAHRHPAAGHPRCQGCAPFARIASSLSPSR